MINLSTLLYVACYVIGISFHVVLPLLRLTVREFEDASRSMNTSRLEVRFRKISILIFVEKFLVHQEKKIPKPRSKRENYYSSGVILIYDTFYELFILLEQLQDAIRCHDTCCRLIAWVDRIASYFFGTTLVLSVPQIAIASSYLNVISQSQAFLWQTVFFFIGFVGFLVAFVLLASAIHREVSSSQLSLGNAMLPEK